MNINKEESLPSFSVDSNLSNWIKGWSSDIGAIDFPYKEAKENPATLNGFQTSMSLKGVSLYLEDIIDDGNWVVDIVIPVVPRNRSDADKWVYRLIVNDLIKKERYLSLDRLEHLETEIIKETPIMRKFEDYVFPGEKVLQKMKNKGDDDLFWKVMAVEDLIPPSRITEVSS